MVAIPGDHTVVPFLEGGLKTHSDSFLADVEMAEPADQAETVELARLLFKAANQDHLLVELQQFLITGIVALVVRMRLLETPQGEGRFFGYVGRNDRLGPDHGRGRTLNGWFRGRCIGSGPRGLRQVWVSFSGSLGFRRVRNAQASLYLSTARSQRCSVNTKLLWIPMQIPRTVLARSSRSHKCMDCQKRKEPALRRALSRDGDGAPGTIRTSDPQIRSLMLYPAELRVLGRRAFRGLIHLWQPPSRGITAWASGMSNGGIGRPASSSAPTQQIALPASFAIATPLQIRAP